MAINTQGSSIQRHEKMKKNTIINKVTILNTILPESLKKQAGQNMEISNKRENMERARNQSWD